MDSEKTIQASTIAVSTTVKSNSTISLQTKPKLSISPEKAPAVSSRATLNEVAYDVHAVLFHCNVKYAFIGGFAIKSLDDRRCTSSIDAEVQKPLQGWRKVVKAFYKTGAYHLLDGCFVTERVSNSRRILTRLVDLKRGVYVYLLERQSRSPKIYQTLDALPFYSITDLLIEKIRSCAERRYPFDPCDVVFLYNFCTTAVDVKQVYKKLTPEEGAKAVRNYPDDQPLMIVIQSLGLLPKLYNLPNVYGEKGLYRLRKLPLCF
ncbi:hypothetical protein M422DRAFT_244446 [Sphaerobolus stellatus SS14]|nr:hypothetical protein M422DRAFT_244446 [Sphaerobolus stellatus SS14]